MKKFLTWAAVLCSSVLVIAMLVFFSVRTAVPSLAGSATRASEEEAVSQLRSLLWAQDNVKKMKLADRNVDGVGEYGFFSALLGQIPVQGGGLYPVLAERAFPRREQGREGAVMIAAGYCYQTFLPSGGGAVAEPFDGREPPGAVDGPEASRVWIAYAWPLETGITGFRTFFINQDEEIWETDGKRSRQGYTGILKGPRFDAALATPDLLQPPRDAGPFGDGGVWVRWRGKKARNAR